MPSANPYRLMVAKAFALMIPAVAGAWFLAFADRSLPHGGITIAIVIANTIGITAGAIVVAIAYTFAERFWRWMMFGTFCSCLGLAAVVSMLAWLYAQDFVVFAAGAADDTLIVLTVFGCVTSCVVTTLVLSLWHLDLRSRQLHNLTIVRQPHRIPTLHVARPERDTA